MPIYRSYHEPIETNTIDFPKIGRESLLESLEKIDKLPLHEQAFDHNNSQQEDFFSSSLEDVIDIERIKFDSENDKGTFLITKKELRNQIIKKCQDHSWIQNFKKGITISEQLEDLVSRRGKREIFYFTGYHEYNLEVQEAEKVLGSAYSLHRDYFTRKIGIEKKSVYPLHFTLLLPICFTIPYVGIPTIIGSCWMIDYFKKKDIRTTILNLREKTKYLDEKLSEYYKK